MKKNISIVCLMIFGLSAPVFAQEFSNGLYEINKIAYTSASSLKYEIKKKKNRINNNECKIKRINTSRNLSENEKRRQIYKLKSENRKLQNEISRLMRKIFKYDNKLT